MAFVLLAVPAGGCVGYIMGWSDTELDRQRRIIAELEAKNAALLEENLRLRERLESATGADSPPTPDSEADIGPEPAAGPAERRQPGE